MAYRHPVVLTVLPEVGIRLSGSHQVQGLCTLPILDKAVH